MKSLAIEREYGSGGRETGILVAERAGIPYYDSDLLIEAAEHYHYNVDMLREYDETKVGSVLYNIALLAGGHSGDQMQLNEMFHHIKETIKRLAEEGPAVFIGRCSTEILKSAGNVVSVFIYSSSAEKRVARIEETEQVGPEDAKKLMRRKDSEREKYFKFWTEKEWKNPGNYEMMLNTAELSKDTCADILLDAMKG